MKRALLLVATLAYANAEPMPEGSVQYDLAQQAIHVTGGLEQVCPSEPMNGFMQMVCSESGLSARDTRQAVNRVMQAYASPKPWKEEASGIQIRDFTLESAPMRFSIYDGGSFVLLYIFR